jgi:hypothetical protein
VWTTEETALAQGLSDFFPLSLLDFIQSRGIADRVS